MTEFEEATIEAEKAFKDAKTKEDVQAVWKKFYLTVGHKALGRLLVGTATAESINERRAERVG